MAKARVAVVLVNWNGVEIIPAALDSLRKQTFKSFETVVVDNNSQDDSIKFITEKYPEVKVISEKKNHGFAKAVNIAVKNINTEYFALLNTDAVADKDWLKQLVRFADTDESLAVVTALSVLPGGKTIDASGDNMSRWGVAFPRMRGQNVAAIQAQSNAEIFSGSGGYSLYRVDAWREIGGFDSAFFMYYEDVDYCYRARLCGYNIGLSPDALITHGLGVSSSKRGKNFSRRYVIRNAQFVYWKNTPSKIIYRTLIKFCFVNMYMLLAAIKSLAFKELAIAYWEFFRALPRIYRQRQRIQAKSNIAWPQVYAVMSDEWPFRREEN